MSSLSIFFKAIHPKDELWHVLLKAKLLKMCISLPGIRGFHLRDGGRGCFKHIWRFYKNFVKILCKETNYYYETWFTGAWKSGQYIGSHLLAHWHSRYVRDPEGPFNKNKIKTKQKKQKTTKTKNFILLRTFLLTILTRKWF